MYAFFLQYLLSIVISFVHDVAEHVMGFYLFLVIIDGLCDEDRFIFRFRFNKLFFYLVYSFFIYSLYLHIINTNAKQFYIELYINIKKNTHYYILICL